MRLPARYCVFAAALALAACSTSDGKVSRAVDDLREARDADLNEIMLTVAEPAESVAYFERLATAEPEAITPQRGLATSLVRAKRGAEGVAAWRKVTAHPEAGPEDSVELADALIRVNEWDEAERVLDAIPPTYETFQRYRLEAMVADSKEQWDRADSFYEIAVGLTTTPAAVMNNWGYSKLTRGDYRAAERLFTDALRQQPGLFTAKNNLVMARAAQRDYTLPVMPMEQSERAQLLHTMALSAIKRGDVETGKGLLREAIDTHPQHFEAAVRSLRALENG